MHNPSRCAKDIKQAVLVSIVIVIQHKSSKFFSLPAFVATLEGKSCEILVVDNASGSSALQACDRVDTNLAINIKTITYEKALPVSEAYNNVIEYANGKYILLYDVNLVLSEKSGWLDKLASFLKTHPTAASVSPQLCTTSFPIALPSFFDKFFSSSIFSGYSFSLCQGKFVIAKVLNNMRIGDERVALPFHCLLFAKSKFIEVKGFDRKLSDDNLAVDFGLKLSALGDNVCVSNLKVGLRGSYQSFFKGFLFRGSQPESEQEYFQKKWFYRLKREYWSEKVRSEKTVYSMEKFTVAIAVTDHGSEVRAGDYFTAQELAASFIEFGWEVIYLSKKKGQWYKVPQQVDLLLSLLDSYDLREIIHAGKLVKVAWARNWFDRWCDNPSFNQYDLVFTSSSKSCEYIKNNSRQLPALLPIATNPERFLQTPVCKNNNFYQSDVCFTGSYWDFPRDIIWGLSEEIISDFSVSIFGANWEKIEKFKAISKGFVEYHNIPCVYHHTKIVIDDANHVTKPYGAVNSRVFDAIISGALVITNGVEGADELFGGELPSYTTQEELDKLIRFYLQNEEKRTEKVDYLRDMILQNHTYNQRASVFREDLEKHCLRTSIAIKVPAPSWEEAKNWGDFHLSVSLKKALERKGYRVLIQVLPEWGNDEGYACDVVIVLRGLSKYQTKSHQLNIMWNISHPDAVSNEEYESYDQVYIASEYWATKVAEEVSVPIESMLQCTDPEVFYEPTDEEKEACREELLFVGNSRKVYRKIIKDLLPTDKRLAVYGQDWEGLISPEYVKGKHIPNERLYKHYGSTKVLLNDHWDDMRNKGFISNRIFDGLACGAQILTDKVQDFGEVGSYLHAYGNSDELLEKLNSILAAPQDPLIKERAKECVLSKHTFDNRASAFCEYINSKLEMGVSK